MDRQLSCLKDYMFQNIKSINRKDNIPPHLSNPGFIALF